MAQLRFPTRLQQYPEPVARETNNYRIVGRGLPRLFYKDFEDKLRERRIRRIRREYKMAKDAHVQVAFKLPDIVMYLAALAAAGILQNLSYDALKWVVRRIRKPKEEIGGQDMRFETVISQETYDRVRREHHPGVRARNEITSVVERRLERKYRLMVTLVDGRGNPKPMNRE